MRHNAIIVTGTNYEGELDKAHAKAKELFPMLVSEKITSPSNGYQSFFVAPDGSIENRRVSEIFDRSRELLCDFIDSLVFDDGSNAVSFVDIGFNEHDEAAIDRTNKAMTEVNDE